LAVAREGGSGVTEFEFFFAFYGLILGLAVAELLNGVAGVVRARRVRKVGLRTVLMAVFTLMALMATWLDAWRSLREVRLAFSDLALPFGIGGLYYLAAVVIFPKDVEAWETLDAYYDERKRYVAALLLGAETLLTATFIDIAVEGYRTNPANFWSWFVPYNLAIHGGLLALVFTRRRWLDVALWSGLILLFLIPYWNGRS
jgi:hypothetical protein